MIVINPYLQAMERPFGRGITRSLGDLRSPWLLTTEPNWDDPPSRNNKIINQVLPSDPWGGILFVTFSGVNRDLHLGYQKVTWKKLVDGMFRNPVNSPVFRLVVYPMICRVLKHHSRWLLVAGFLVAIKGRNCWERFFGRDDWEL